MALTIKVTVIDNGLDEVQKNISGLDAAICDTVSEDIQATAAAFAPVRTGFMRANIDRETGGNTFVVEAKAPYSGFVEFGTRKMSAQPFMIPGVESADIDGDCQEALKRVGF